MSSKRNIANQSNARNRVTQLRARKRRRSLAVQWLLKLGVVFSFVVVFYALSSFWFYGPRERELEQSIALLEQNLEVLEARYDTLNMVLKNVELRDKNVFNIMFEANPQNTKISYRQRALETKENALQSSANELIRILKEKNENLENKVDLLVESNAKMLFAMDSVGSATLARIPSIQPIANPSLNLLTASFGERIHPFYKRLQPHRGVDFTIPEGTRVFATADGVIKSYSINQSSTGKSVTIDHGNGYETVYNHLSIIDIPRSRRVKQGDIIGMSGNTGLSLAPHLHYEVIYKGEHQNPIHYFFEELSPASYQQILKIAESGMQSLD